MVSSVFFNSLDLFWRICLIVGVNNWFCSSFFSVVDESVYASRHDDDEVQEVQVMHVDLVRLCEEMQRMMR